MELAKENRHWVLKSTFSPPGMDIAEPAHDAVGDGIKVSKETILADTLPGDIAELAHDAVGGGIEVSKETILADTLPGGTTEPAHDAVGGVIEVLKETIVAETLPEVGIEVLKETIVAETLPGGGIDLENFIKVCLPCREANVPPRCNACGDEVVYRTKCGLCESHGCARSQWCEDHGPDPAPPTPIWLGTAEAVDAVEEKLEAKKEVSEEERARHNLTHIPSKP